MSRLAELRARNKAPRTDEKNSISLETELTKPTKAPSVGFVGSISGEYEFFSPPKPKERLVIPAVQDGETGRNSDVAQKEPTAACEPEKKLHTLEQEPTKPTKAPSVGSVGSISGSMKFFSQSATAAPATPEPPAPTGTESQIPLKPKDRLCYQCHHFQRSPYGYPLGLCAEHGMPEGLFSNARGNRIQHATSHPAQFGCVDFSLRAPDTDICTVCRHYHPDSTMCHVVNTGCPLPAIPPCTGAHFEPKEVRHESA